VFAAVVISLDGGDLRTALIRLRMMATREGHWG
jgi:hypothetical protein